MITQVFPILSTPDLGRALAFYRDLLGGTVAFEFPVSGGEPAYVGVDIGSSHIGIGADPNRTPHSGSARVSLWAYTDDCDSTIARLRAAGVTITEEPTDQPWGERVARVLDPDGNVVVIGRANRG